MPWLFILAISHLILLLIFRLIWYKRFKQYEAFPQLPPSLLLGHLKSYNDIACRGPSDRDNDHIFAEIHDILGQPPLVLMDFRPICKPVLFITSHEVAEQISRPTKQFPTSVPKVDLRYLEPVIGSTSILAAEGEKWRALRKTFNHGFSVQNLMTHLPTILDKTMILVDQLDTLSVSGDEASLVSLTMDLTLNVIGAVMLDVDLDAQHFDPCQRGQLVRAFSDLLKAYWDDKLHLPWWFNPVGELKRRLLGKRVDGILKSIIRHNYQEKQKAYIVGEKILSTRAPSIMSLSLQGTTVLSDEVLSKTCDQLRTFLLGGHDTPSATLAWVFYELSRTPRAQRAVQAELDALFGPGTDSEVVRAQLVSPVGPDLLGRMSYITAVIKETLRLHTPASTARYSAPGNGLVVNLPAGGSLPLDGLIVYNCNSIIHRDRTIFGPNADHFIPERWLENNISSSGGIKPTIPPSAWRPFERGPRACIGQELANIEMRVVIAVLARQYKFVKTGLGELMVDPTTGLPMLRDDGQYEVKSHVYNTRQITARPVDGIMVKVKRIHQDLVPLH